MQALREKMQEIITAKQSEIQSVDPLSIDHSVMSEEIEDAKYVIESIDKYSDEIELHDHLRRVMNSTTSGRIYDALGKIFPKEYVQAKPL